MVRLEVLNESVVFEELLNLGCAQGICSCFDATRVGGVAGQGPDRRSQFICASLLRRGLMVSGKGDAWLEVLKPQV